MYIHDLHPYLADRRCTFICKYILNPLHDIHINTETVLEFEFGELNYVLYIEIDRIRRRGSS